MPKTVLIGSDASCDFPIAFEGVSFRHCRVRFEDGEIWVEDLDSANGTYVDGRRIEPGRQQRIDPSSELSLGGSVTLSHEDIRALGPDVSANRPNQQEAEGSPSATTSKYEPLQGYSGFRQRAAAFVIDGVILWFLFLVVGGPILYLIALGSSGPPGTEARAVLNLVAGLFQFVYFGLHEASELQATPGKQIIGIKVIDMEGSQIGFGRALGRNFGKIASSIVLFIGYFMAGWTEKHQALHDMMAGCLVVNEE